jgi:hypothetical protein
MKIPIADLDHFFDSFEKDPRLTLWVMDGYPMKSSYFDEFKTKYL